jgi:hypothetical protein
MKASTLVAVSLDKCHHLSSHNTRYTTGELLVAAGEDSLDLKTIDDESL